MNASAIGSVRSSVPVGNVVQRPREVEDRAEVFGEALETDDPAPPIELHDPEVREPWQVLVVQRDGHGFAVVVRNLLGCGGALLGGDPFGDALDVNRATRFAEAIHQEAPPWVDERVEYPVHVR